MDYNEVAYVHKLFVDDNKLKPAAYEQNVRVYRKGGRNLLPIKRIGVEEYVVDWEAENLKERPRKKHKPRRNIPLYLRPSGNKYIGSALEERERERDFLEKGGILLEPNENTVVLEDCVSLKSGKNTYLIKNGEVLIQISEREKIINFNFDSTHSRFKGKK